MLYVTLPTGLYHRIDDWQPEMLGPTFTFAFMIATLFGAVFHFILGGDVRRLALFLLAAWVGFGLGHMLGEMLSIDILMIGPLRIVSASIGAILALVAAYLLTRSRAGHPGR